MAELKSKIAAVFITGGGKGFGRACALSAATTFHDNSLIIICGRHKSTLAETEKMIKDKNQSIKVEIFELDLETVDKNDIKPIFQHILKVESTPYECFVIIHNAGTINNMTKMSYQFDERTVLQSYVNTNVTGTIVVNNTLLDHIKLINGDHNAFIIIVNVSSLAAIEPFPSASLYCSVKACREMFFRCLSNEWSNMESMRMLVVNYAPGPMDTDMMTTFLRDNSDKSVTESVRKQVMQPSTSSDKLFGKILSNYSNLESGLRFDYFDEC